MGTIKKSEINRIEQVIDALMQVARGDYNVQVPLSEKNDHIDALAMGFNTMVDDLKVGKEFERENKKIKSINTELEKAKKEVEESNQLISAFISNLSHEIRTPMNGIIGFSSLLAENESLDETSQNYIQIIVNSSNQLLRIIDDILEISKLETKQIKLYEEEVNLNFLMIELFNIFNIKSKERKVPLYLKRTLSDEASTIYTDKAKLIKILSNLLENALKYTNFGSVEFGYVCESSNIKIYVKDTGIGVPKEKQEIIFDRFSQAENSSSGKNEGLGLGLSIAKENATLLGGEIGLESEIGKGSTFYITIPNKCAKLDASKNLIEEEASNKIKVLVVEDEEVNALYLETILRKISTDINIVIATSGEEAVELCKQNNRFDVILMDIKLPEMNGVEATKQIKQIYPELTVIAQTAFSADFDSEKIKDTVFDSYIQKPISKEALIIALEECSVMKKTS